MLFLFVACASIIKEALARLRHPIIPEVTVFSFAVIAVTLGVNIFVMQYEKRMGKKHVSDILVSDALHTQSDIFVSLAVIVTLFAIKGGFFFLDTIVSLGIALFIAKAGFEIFKSTSHVLSDAIAVDHEKIERIVLGMEGVKSCHMIRSRGSQHDIYVDLHVEFDPDLTIRAAYAINENIMTELKNSIPGVKEVLINTEPYHP